MSIFIGTIAFAAGFILGVLWRRKRKRGEFESNPEHDGTLRMLRY